MVYQLEQGDSGTPHLQGTVQFIQRTSFGKAKASIHKQAHIEKMKSPDPQSSINYCKKVEGRIAGPWKFGTFIAKGSMVRAKRK